MPSRVAAQGHVDALTPAEDKWGCAYGRCPRKAHVIVTSSRGSQWGACRKHIEEVRRAAGQ